MMTGSRFIACNEQCRALNLNRSMYNNGHHRKNNTDVTAVSSATKSHGEPTLDMRARDRHGLVRPSSPPIHRGSSHRNSSDSSTNDLRGDSRASSFSYQQQGRIAACVYDYPSASVLKNELTVLNPYSDCSPDHNHRLYNQEIEPTSQSSLNHAASGECNDVTTHDPNNATQWVRNTFFHPTNPNLCCTSASPTHNETGLSVRASSDIDLAPPSWMNKEKENSDTAPSSVRLLSVGRKDRFESSMSITSDKGGHESDSNAYSRSHLFPPIRPVTSTLETFDTAVYDRFPTDGILQFFLQELQAREKSAQNGRTPIEDSEADVAQLKAQDALLNYCQGVLRSKCVQANDNEHFPPMDDQNEQLKKAMSWETSNTSSPHSLSQPFFQQFSHLSTSSGPCVPLVPVVQPSPSLEFQNELRSPSSSSSPPSPSAISYSKASAIDHIPRKDFTSMPLLPPPPSLSLHTSQHEPNAKSQHLQMTPLPLDYRMSEVTDCIPTPEAPSFPTSPVSSCSSWNDESATGQFFAKITPGQISETMPECLVKESSASPILIFQRADVQIYRRNRTSSNITPPDSATALSSTITVTQNENIGGTCQEMANGENTSTSSAPEITAERSILHPNNCKPCAFFWTKGCVNGASCQFCHEWHPPKKKKPMKDQKNLMIIARPDGKIEFLRCTIQEALGRS